MDERVKTLEISIVVQRGVETALFTFHTKKSLQILNLDVGEHNISKDRLRMG